MHTHMHYETKQLVNEAAKFRYRSGNEFNCGKCTFHMRRHTLPLSHTYQHALTSHTHPTTTIGGLTSPNPCTNPTTREFT